MSISRARILGKPQAPRLRMLISSSSNYSTVLFLKSFTAQIHPTDNLFYSTTRLKGVISKVRLE